MTRFSKNLGIFGEDKARKFLEEKGLIFLAKNLRLKAGEIDLLMLDKKTLVVVEVKTKSDLSYGPAAEMITFKKRKKLLQLARSLYQKYPNDDVRIDVVTVDRNTIKHLVSAVEEE